MRTKQNTEGNLFVKTKQWLWCSCWMWMNGGKMPSRNLGVETLKCKTGTLGFWPILEVTGLGIIIKATVMANTFKNHEDWGSRKQLWSSSTLQQQREEAQPLREPEERWQQARYCLLPSLVLMKSTAAHNVLLLHTPQWCPSEITEVACVCWVFTTYQTQFHPHSNPVR